MKVFFRADASDRMGTGHLMRCLALAEALRERGAQTRFVCREHSGHLVSLLQQKGMPVTVLPAPAPGGKTPGEDYAVWLGVTQDADVRQTIGALNGEKPDWMVIDHYGLDIDWQQRLRQHAGKLMVIDDLANRHHECDVLLDQNYSVDGERRYAGLVPNTCKVLVGPRYALLRPEYAAYRRTLRQRDGRVKRVLVYFGGSDQRNMTGLTLDALSQAALCHLEVDVIVGANNPHREQVEKQAEERPQTVIYGPRPHLADLMAQADLAIGAGGATTWERMCLGLPSIVVSIAENQRGACEALSQSEMIQYVGDATSVCVGELAGAIAQFAEGSDRLLALSTRNRLLVDGYGTSRIIDTLEAA